MGIIMNEILKSIKELNKSIDLLENNFQNAETLKLKLKDQENKHSSLKLDIQNLRTELVMIIKSIEEKSN